jgi:phage gp36-like protein
VRAIKQVGEEVTFTYDFSPDLGASTIATVIGVPSSVARDGGANLVQEGLATITPDGTGVLVKWTGGVAGESYATTVKVTDTAGDEHERDGQIDVVETAFVLPENISSRYLTAEEYVERYGYAETVRLTDEDKTNTVDGAKLEAAIKDATDLADSYIGTRYTTPLVATPRVVKSIVAALARELLHKSRPTPEVTAAPARNCATLRRAR